ncbi:hypothetical protein B9T25_05945 [Acinetobacter sp. ANC 4470]|uniref:META and DUF4377 domain-containing protein n=1 Tax=Acinetobacter sp. ANC 4470 TaxID=1977881 RepID=UPI000A33A599|nr:META and DUF4377 domain-containing protein [Acinetobacter sp. ANC 4470]OTG68231.1 hypothetical protein B9T25_05945 [Acinetobacter sp. ANC 4470]
MKLKFLAIALFPLMLAACQSSDMQKAGDLAVSMIQQQNADKTLAAYQWSYQPQGTDKPLVLNFNDQQRLSIATGCNTQGTSWKIEKGQIVTADLMSTMMACSPELMKQEQFSSSLFAKRTIPFVLNIQDVNKPTLTLIDATGQKVVFEGKMTPETQYQTQAETIFLEISPETKKCTGVAPQTCLQVREIKYAENGVKTQVDKDWGLFYSHIEGFEHNPSERQIIRVKRYEIKNPAADQSKYAYVHDMTIERATIK